MTLDFSKEEFTKTVAPLERELMAHCYRFMGSLQDSEDMLQETMLKAWNRRESLESKESQRAWMYKIATNVCLDNLRKRKRRGMPHIQFPAADPNAAFPPPVTEPVWLEPYPDNLLPIENNQPEKAISMREDINLAFMTALHLLPPKQRAALILMDVLDWAAKEVAQTLDITVSAANSALYRARKKLKEEDVKNSHEDILHHEIEDLLTQYVEAWENSDIEKLTKILSEDARFTMPPFSCWYAGRDAIKTIVSTVLFANPAVPAWKLFPTQANGQPAFALYQLDSEAGGYKAFGIMVLRIQRGKIAEISAFLNPAIFPFFKLPMKR